MFPNLNLNALLNEIRSRARNTTEHGDWFEYISDYALRNTAAYGEQIDTIERYETWAARVRPDLPATLREDNGVDRIATTFSGELWAIQNKGYKAGREGSLTDFTNFTAQAIDIVHADKLFWVTSGAGLNKKSTAHNAVGKLGVIVHNLAWLRAGINYPETFAELRVLLEDGREIAPDEPFKLRIHQEIAISKIKAGLATNPAVQFISACGTGKTVTTHALIAALSSTATAFFVPTLGLMRQSIASYRQQSAGNLTVIAVCSDDSMLKQEDDDHLVVTAQEFGQHLIRKPDELAEVMADAQTKTFVDATGVTRPLPVVVFSTYDSAHILVEAQHSFDAPAFNLVIADEAHYLAGKGEYGELVKAKDDGRQRLRAVKRVYTTATPRVVEEHRRGKHGFDSMDPTSEVFGPQAHVLTFGEAIQLGILSDYKLSIVVVPDEILKFIEENWGVDGVSAQYLAAAYAMQRAIADGDRKFISYHSRVKDAKDFAGLVTAERIAELTDTIWGALNSQQREEAIEKFKSATGAALLTNVRCLNEGVDIPALNTVIFIDPKSQVVDIIQSIGRVLRLHENKVLGHIIVPIPMSSVAFDEGMSIEDVSAVMRKDERWKTAFNVVKAIGQHDKVLQQEIEVLVRGGGSRTIVGQSSARSTSRIDRIFVDLVGEQAEEFRKTLASGLTLAVHRDVAGTWSERYGQLREWLTVNDGVYPSTKKDGSPVERSLAGWVGAQVSAQRHGDLSEERLGYLAALAGWFERAATSIELLERDLNDYVDWTVANGRVPKAGGETVVEQYLGGRRSALSDFFAKYGGDLSELGGAGAVA